MKTGSEIFRDVVQLPLYWPCTACPANCKTCTWDETKLRLTCSRCYDTYQKTTYGTCDCTYISLCRL